MPKSPKGSRLKRESSDVVIKIVSRMNVTSTSNKIEVETKVQPLMLFVPSVRRGTDSTNAQGDRYNLGNKGSHSSYLVVTLLSNDVN